MKLLLSRGFNRFLSNNVKRSHKRTMVKRPTYPKVLAKSPTAATTTITSKADRGSNADTSGGSKYSNTSNSIKTFDWFKKINEVNVADDEKRFEAILKQLLNFTSIDKIEELKPSFELYFKQRLLTFGDLNIPLEKGEDEERRVAAYKEVISKLIDRDVDGRKHRGREERPSLGVVLGKLGRGEKGEAKLGLMAEFEREWNLLSKPKLANVSKRSFGLLEKVVVESRMSASTLQEYIAELRACQHEVSVREVNKYLRTECAEGLNKSKFKEVTDFVNVHRLPLNDESYVILMNGLLKYDEYPLYLELVENFNAQGLTPNRHHLRSLQDYFALVGDFGKFVNVLELQINDYGMNLNEPDLENIIKGLNVMGRRSLSMDVLNIVLSIRQRFELVHHSVLSTTPTRRTTDEEHSYERAYVIVDAVQQQQQQLVEYVPVLTGRMFKWPLLTSGAFDDVLELLGDVRDFGVPLELDTLKAVLVTLKLFQREAYFLQLLRDGEHSGLLAVLARGLAQDRECVELVLDVLQRTARKDADAVVQALQQGEVERSVALLKLLIQQ